MTGVQPQPAKPTAKELERIAEVVCYAYRDWVRDDPTLHLDAFVDYAINRLIGVIEARTGKRISE